MITIKPHGKFNNGFTVRGHAGFGKHGEDIVCASVSVVTQMIAFEINHKGYGGYHIEDGELTVHIEGWAQDKVKDYTEMMERTLYALKLQHPDHIKIKEEF